MAGWEGWLRSVVVGRKNGIRATLRRELNVATWLDEEPDPEPPPEPEPTAGPAWRRVASRSELPAEGDVVEAFAEDRAVVLVRVAGEVYAIDSICPHAGGPLGEGELDGQQLTCPWHGWSFDVATGTCGVDPTMQLETFDVRVEGNDVFVAPRDPSSSA
ncbi:MAG: Rieske (2Fe-2S) protein [Myxococcota bacterium]